MKLPNKLYSYKESTISKFPVILDAIDKGKATSISELYIEVIDKMEDITEFLEVLECLYALRKIEYSLVSRRVNYAI